MAGQADQIDCVFDVVGPAGSLAHPGGEVEVVVGRVASPGHHVEDGGLAHIKPAGVGEGPRYKDLDPESQSAVIGLVGELPLVLETAVGPDGFEGSNPHDEIVDEGAGDGQEASEGTRQPFLIYDRILEGGLDVVGVEDDFREVHVGEADLLPDGDVPHVVGGVDDLGVNVELQGFGPIAPDPQAGHEYYHMVAAEGSGEGREGSSVGLGRVVYVVGVVPKIIDLGGYVDLPLSKKYDVPRGVVHGHVVEGVEVVGEARVHCQVGHRQDP